MMIKAIRKTWLEIFFWLSAFFGWKQKNRQNNLTAKNEGVRKSLYLIIRTGYPKSRY